MEDASCHKYLRFCNPVFIQPWKKLLKLLIHHLADLQAQAPHSRPVRPDYGSIVKNVENEYRGFFLFRLLVKISFMATISLSD